ncbi:MAG: class I SAM-dependent methyltransferase [Actinomycetota bacterium]|nr:class I SAM-dependent methyltransferase [Actinomycetota bacterium]
MIRPPHRFSLLEPIDSVTHAHLVLAAAREVQRRPRTESVRLLDVGCGDGRLLLAMVRHLPGLIGRPIAPSGFDVSDSAVQQRGFFKQTEDRLQAAAPEIAWAGRLALRTVSEPWPAADGEVDLAITNQVLEHIENLPRFLSELARVLAPGGIALNLFPTVKSIVEGHIGVPWSHRIRSDDVRRAYLEHFAKAGLARLGPLRMDAELDPREWARSRSDYLRSETWYRSWSEIADAAKAAHLHASYRWTPDFYLLKLAYVLRQPTLVRYSSRRRSALVDALLFSVFQRLASVSICFEKSSSYDPGDVRASTCETVE